jgi:hypothetical protein
MQGPLMSRRADIASLVLATMALLALPGTAAAELVVSAVKGTDVAVGARFPDEHVFRLPARSELQLLKSPDNAPFVMRGPFQGTLSNYIENCTGALASVHRYCRPEEVTSPLGGTRGPRREPK